MKHKQSKTTSPQKLQKKGFTNQAAGAVGFDFSSNGTENFEIPLEKSQFKVLTPDFRANTLPIAVIKKIQATILHSFSMEKIRK